MKRKHVLLWAILLLLAIWLISVAWVNMLTFIHGSEFQNTKAIGFTGMHPWEDEAELRVLFYTKNKAEVYYYAKTGGEKALFINNNGKWEYEKTVLTWSSYGGTADDYFIWPYFKNWVI